jgi:hypothetical protein
MVNMKNKFDIGSASPQEDQEKTRIDTLFPVRSRLANKAAFW